MKAVLIDAYRSNDNIVLWLKTPEENIRLVKGFSTYIYLEKCDLAKDFLRKNKFTFKLVEKNTYVGGKKLVYSVQLKKLSKYERIVRKIERETKHRLIIYDADIAPEQEFLYRNQLKPFALVEIIENNIIPLKQEAAINLKTLKIDIFTSKDIRIDETTAIKKIIFGNTAIKGSEKEILLKFTKKFRYIDPDVLIVEEAFSKIPYLIKRLDFHGIKCPIHRWDEKPIKKKGGKTFFSYGKTVYREFAIRLNGRFLIDANSTVGEECKVDGIAELSYLSGNRFQQIASRSFGAVFQSAIVAEMIKRNYIVPFKEKPVDPPISLYHQLKFDRVGHTFDPIVGLHHNVAEIDFTSLFPWIVYNYNISTETLLGGNPPYRNVPGLPIKISLEKKGIVPASIKPLLDRRMHYKRNPSAINEDRLAGLKWVLVTSYGYLRFREFKLGISSSHMAIGAFARDIMIKTKEICEKKGFRIIHGIVDSLYIQKEGITKEKVLEVCEEIELEIGIPISFEGIFKWIVFLPSVNNKDRPVPSRYYGAYGNGKIKARGLEVRQAASPKIVKKYQADALKIISVCNSKEEILQKFHYLCQLMRNYIYLLPTYDADMLASSVRISKADYEKNIAQKLAVELMKKKGILAVAGQKVSYVFGNKGVMLPEDYDKKPDVGRYKQKFVRSLFVLLQPFGFSKKEINSLTGNDKQSSILDYAILDSKESEVGELLSEL